MKYADNSKSKIHKKLFRQNLPGSLAGYCEKILALKLTSEAASKDSGGIGEIKSKT